MQRIANPSSRVRLPVAPPASISRAPVGPVSFSAPISAQRPDGETGRRSGLKIRRPRNGACGFEPRSGHHAEWSQMKGGCSPVCVSTMLGRQRCSPILNASRPHAWAHHEARRCRAQRSVVATAQPCSVASPSRWRPHRCACPASTPEQCGLVRPNEPSPLRLRDRR